jgi:hypothetical protein
VAAVSIYDEPPPYVTPRRRQTQRALNIALAVAIVVGATVVSVAVVRVSVEAVMGQCAPPWLTGTDPQLCLSAQVSQGTLSVTGGTSLADGAVVQIWADDYGTGSDQHWGADPVNVTVAGGSFGESFDVSSWGPGTITVTAFFEIGAGQPQALVDRYGADGERLNGPDVRLDLSSGNPDTQAVQVSTNVDLSAG